MRDPKRIRKFCNRLASAWECMPDWRFGQLILNCMDYQPHSLFYTEDDEMIEGIEKYIEMVLSRGLKGYKKDEQD